MQIVSGAVLEQWAGLSDEDIVRRVIQGQTALFEVLMRRHNERIYRAVRAILRGDQGAEDVMQQAYVNAYSHLRQFDGRAAFATWLTRIAANEAISQARKQGRCEPIDSEDEIVESISSTSAAPDPERLAFARELAALLEAAVEELPDGCREVFVLREIQGMSTAETAAVLEVTDDAVKTRLSRAKATLRRDLLERAGLSAPHTFLFHQSRCDRVVAGVFARIGRA